MTSEKHSRWETTRLWNELRDRTSAEADGVRAVLTLWMPEIESVLKSGGTSPLDFTLHDADHSFRVAERMVEIVPGDVLPRLSTYELALLLLSAYLHDVGMTPARNKVRSHRDFLLTGEPGTLSEDERAALQRWLDERGYGVEPPVAPDRPVDEQLRLVDEMVTYYSRHRHNDWSEEWVREHHPDRELGSYRGWVDDLIVLCRSHHEGYDRLVGKRFDPLNVGSPPQTVHLRYLAAVLRVADVLDVDPERTPEVILHHRDITDSSLIYWHKDQELSLKREGARLIVSARPSRAYLERAIRDTIADIEAELVLCRRLADATRFEKPVGPGSDLPHRWDLEPFVFPDIRPVEGAYEYIDGAFRPNTERLLELLSGTQLYGTPLAAVRELLQNAFDAVRELIAYERLEESNPADKALEQRGADRHKVQLSVEEEGGRTWLVCRDTGIGMTKGIVRDHFLVSGSPRRHQLLDLERKCATAGFNLGRTGQFGIGALSYFMLADRVVLTTRRAQEPGDEEGTGWTFQSDGIGAFGELRREPRAKRGTEVRLRLRAEVLQPDWSSWVDSLEAYLAEILRYLPCRFEFAGETIRRLAPGWTAGPEIHTENVLQSLKTRHSKPSDRVPDHLLPVEAREQRYLSRSFRDAAIGEAKRVLRWQIVEGSLPGGAGRYRISLPYYELPGCGSLAFLRIIQRGDGLWSRSLGEQDGHVGLGMLLTSWRGIRTDFTKSGSGMSPLDRLDQVIPGVEVDLTSAGMGEIAVSRGVLSLTGEGLAVLAWLEEEVRRTLVRFSEEHGASAFALLNARIASASPFTREPFWISQHERTDPESGDTERAWKPMYLPAGGFVFSHSRTAVTGDGRCVTLPYSLHLGALDLLDWYSGVTAPDRVVIHAARYPRVFGVSPLWTQLRATSSRRWSTGDFPPEWDHLLAVSWENARESLRVLNHGVELVQRLQWDVGALAFESASRDPLEEREKILMDPGAASAWLLMFALHGSRDVWNGLADRDPSFLPSVWERIGRPSDASGSISVLVQYGVVPITGGGVARHLVLHTLSPYAWEEVADYAQIAALLPMPGPEWQLWPATADLEPNSRD